MSVKILDLFCGGGGFFQGFSTLLNEAHLAIDIDEHALETYKLNHPNATIMQTDINILHSQQIEEEMGGTPDIIIASPPCEEFSKANSDTRGSATEKIYGDGTAKLLLDAIRIIGDLSPKVFVIENVAALLLDGGKEIIIREFQRVGIENIEFNLIRAHQHGNPSKRLRVFISNIRFKPPRKSPPTVMETIGDLPSLDIDEIFNPGERMPNHEVYPLVDDKMKSVRKTRWGRGAKHFRVSKKRSLPNWVRLFPDRLATSINGLSRYVHPYEHRLLSVREHARLMSYPDSFVFVGPTDSQYNQVGESVPPLISHLIAQEVRAHIE
ncbi:MAG: DNA cytosine methyltransferase [Candidatus Thorarchaeota archaeon]|nr:DNA cytosine methyltransferase [Candidatus Thorarchaeota archaeon]